ncbi:MAG: S-methyl-5-thioribose-1-phosphate isomerase [Syntrophobacteraceae bacterium]
MPPIKWEGEAVAILDQRILPHREKILFCVTPEQVIRAIKTMAIRGAPAVGVAGALALALGARSIQTEDPKEFRQRFKKICAKVREARPTGANLGWAVERVHSIVVENPNAQVSELQKGILAEANAILQEDIAANVQIGKWGREVVPKGARILTYCNAGALATADYGTALGVIRASFEADPTISVYSCETRPFLQGARLTVFELMRAGIPVTLITDNAVGSLMSRGMIDVVIVGADRIAANGDTANKIGTYMVAVLAWTHNVAFYIAAPRSTIDPGLQDGSGIPIEQRDPSEVTNLNGKRIAPQGVSALNPAFDVTPSKYISGIITEVGVLRKPFTKTIRKGLQV